MSLGYSPPYESPIEERFAWAISKYLDPSTHLRSQVTVDTVCGRFIIDFVVGSENRQVGFECDGQEFHEYDHDTWRDASILGSSQVDTMYHLSGSVVNNKLQEALHVISLIEPDLFSERGGINIRALSRIQDESALVMAEELVACNWDTSHVVVTLGRLSRKSENPVWRRMYDYASDHRQFPLDEILKRFNDEGRCYLRDGFVKRI